MAKVLETCHASVWQALYSPPPFPFQAELAEGPPAVGIEKFRRFCELERHAQGDHLFYYEGKPRYFPREMRS